MKPLWKLFAALLFVCSGFQHEISAQEKAANSQLTESVVYKILVTEEAFEAAKQADPNFKSSVRLVGDVQVISQLSAVEIAARLTPAAENKMTAPNTNLVKEVTPQIKVYKLVVDEARFNQVKASKKPFNFSKMMMGDDVQFVESSAEEKKAFAAMVKNQKKIKVGDAFPVFSLKTADGKLVTEDVFQGKLTLLNFYFSKCEPCIKETPDLNRFAKNNPQVQTLAITFDSAKQAQDYVAQHQFAWPILVDGSKLIHTDIGLMSYPSFALVDGQGKVLGLGDIIELGIIDHNAEPALVAWIAKLIEGKTSPQKAAP